MKNKKIKKNVFKLLTGVIVGSAVGSILGLTLAPKKGKDSRKYIKDNSMKIYLNSKKALKNKNMPLFKKILIKILTRKK